MVQKIIDKIVEKQIQENILKTEDESIYKYGYMLVFEVLLNISLALIIGVLFDSLRDILFFLCIYIPLRSFCGGWHADKIWKCTFVSNVIFVIEIFFEKYIVKYIDIWELLVIFFIGIIIIFLMAPVETKTKKISKKEKIIYKKKIYFITMIHVIGMVVIVMFPLQNYIFIIAYAYLVQLCMMFFGKLENNINQ